VTSSTSSDSSVAATDATTATTTGLGCGHDDDDCHTKNGSGEKAVTTTTTTPTDTLQDISAIVDGSSSSIIGMPCSALGDPIISYYNAPEVSRGQYDAQSEVYSFGVVLLELLTGHQVDKDITEYIGEMTNDGINPYGLIVVEEYGGMDEEEVVAELQYLVVSCLQTRPSTRPSSMQEVLNKLVKLFTRVNAICGVVVVVVIIARKRQKIQMGSRPLLPPLLLLLQLLLLLLLPPVKVMTSWKGCAALACLNAHVAKSYYSASCLAMATSPVVMTV